MSVCVCMCGFSALTPLSNINQNAVFGYKIFTGVFSLFIKLKLIKKCHKINKKCSKFPSQSKICLKVKYVIGKYVICYVTEITQRSNIKIADKTIIIVNKN